MRKLTINTTEVKAIEDPLKEGDQIDLTIAIVGQADTHKDCIVTSRPDNNCTGCVVFEAWRDAPTSHSLSCPYNVYNPNVLFCSNVVLTAIDDIVEDI